MYSNEIVSFTTTENGVIFENETAKPTFLKNFNNIYELDLFNKYQNILEKNVRSKQLLINILSNNYSVFLIPIQTTYYTLYQYFFEEWRLPSMIFEDKFLKKGDPNLSNINNYSIEEREIICGLLLGHIQDKELIIFFKNNKSERTIRRVISNLYEKFYTNNRISLVRNLRNYGLNRYLPETLFPAGVYNINLKKIS